MERDRHSQLALRYRQKGRRELGRPKRRWGLEDHFGIHRNRS